MKYKFGVIGNPVSHSLSPLMHNAAFGYYNLDYEYERILIPSEKELAVFLKNSAVSYRGLNVTLPYKASVIKHLDWIEDKARLSSSVNVISINDSGLFKGYSTDGYGLETALKLNFGSEPKTEKYLFLGCGGAANSCIVHLLSCGAKDIVIANRTKSKADELVVNLKNHFPSATLSSCSLYDFDMMKNFISQDYLVTQSTSLGLKDGDELPIDGNLLSDKLRVFDMIYKETRLQKLAKAKGCKCFGGLDMLLYQGAKAFEIWTELEAPVEIMRKALIKNGNI